MSRFKRTDSPSHRVKLILEPVSRTAAITSSNLAELIKRHLAQANLNLSLKPEPGHKTGTIVILLSWTWRALWGMGQSYGLLLISCINRPHDGYRAQANLVLRHLCCSSGCFEFRSLLRLTYVKTQDLRRAVSIGPVSSIRERLLC